MRLPRAYTTCAKMANHRAKRERAVDPDELQHEPRDIEAALALMELASNPDYQIWGDPRDGADAMAAAAS